MVGVVETSQKWEKREKCQICLANGFCEFFSLLIFIQFNKVSPSSFFVSRTQTTETAILFLFYFFWFSICNSLFELLWILQTWQQTGNGKNFPEQKSKSPTTSLLILFPKLPDWHQGIRLVIKTKGYLQFTWAVCLLSSLSLLVSCCPLMFWESSENCPSFYLHWMYLLIWQHRYQRNDLLSGNQTFAKTSRGSVVSSSECWRCRKVKGNDFEAGVKCTYSPVFGQFYLSGTYIRAGHWQMLSQEVGDFLDKMKTFPGFCIHVLEKILALFFQLESKIAPSLLERFRLWAKRKVSSIADCFFV